MQITSRSFRQAAAFLLGLVLLVCGLSWVFLPKDNTKEAGIERLPCYGFLSEPENILDVVILGNSVPLFSVAPPVLWDTYGIPSYVCANPSKDLPYFEVLLEEILKTQSPKIVILEADVICREFDPDMRTEKLIESRIPLLRYHDNWKTVSLGQMLRPLHYSNVLPEKGYVLSADVKPYPQAGTDYVDLNETMTNLPAINRKILKRMKALCEQAGAELIFVSIPNAICYGYGKALAVTQIARELNIEYLDMNRQNVGIDWLNDTMDGGDHLNWWGAEKATRYLGDYLMKTGSLTDKRQVPAYTDWNTVCLEMLNNAQSLTPALVTAS